MHYVSLHALPISVPNMIAAILENKEFKAARQK
jgi:hypothetical protein